MSTAAVPALVTSLAMKPGVVVRLTTDHAVYHRGQPVVMTLRETNVTNHAIAVGIGPSIDGFFITQRGKVAWRSNPGIQPLFVRLEVIPPHQSLTLTATWDGPSNEGPPSHPTGLLTVHSEIPGARPVAIRILAR